MEYVTNEQAHVEGVYSSRVNSSVDDDALEYYLVNPTDHLLCCTMCERAFRPNIEVLIN